MPAPAVYVPSRVGEGYFTDFNAPAAGSTDTGKVWAWNSSTGKFEPITLMVYETAGAVATHAALTATHGVSGAIVGTTDSQALSNKTLTTPTIASFVNATHDHSNAAGGGTLSGYLLATGATTGGTSSRQQFTNGLKVGTLQPISDGVTAYQIQATGGTVALNVDTTNNRVGFGGNVAPAKEIDVTGSVKYSTALIGPVWGPASDSTTALKVTKADLSTAVLTVDTTNSRVGVGTTPTGIFHVFGAGSSSVPVLKVSNNSSNYIAFYNDGNGNWICRNENGGSFGVSTNGTPNTVLSLGSGSMVAFCNAANPAGTADIGIGRNAAGVLEIHNGALGTFRDLILRNLGVGTIAQLGGGVGVVAIKDASTLPTSNPTGGGVLYSDAGALKWRGSSGTVTTIAVA